MLIIDFSFFSLLKKKKILPRSNFDDRKSSYRRVVYGRLEKSVFNNYFILTNLFVQKNVRKSLPLKEKKIRTLFGVRAHRGSFENRDVVSSLVYADKNHE